jgi:hypothetical protein
MDNWKKLNINHPKKGLVPIWKLSPTERGHALVDLSHKVADLQAQLNSFQGALSQMGEAYGNYIATLQIMTKKERDEIFG